MNKIATTQEQHTLLQKLEELSAKTDKNRSLTLSLNEDTKRRVQSILKAHDSIEFYRTEFSEENATKMQRSMVSVGALVNLPPEDNPSLIDMKMAYGERETVSCMMSHISAMNAASGASNRMDGPAILLCCRDIITMFPWLTIGELAIFCIRMRALKYARNRSDYVFSEDTVMRGLNEFRSDRVAEIGAYDREHPRAVEMTEWERNIPEDVRNSQQPMSYEEYCRIYNVKPRCIDHVAMIAKHVDVNSSSNK